MANADSLMARLRIRTCVTLALLAMISACASTGYYMRTETPGGTIQDIPVFWEGEDSSGNGVISITRTTALADYPLFSGMCGSPVYSPDGRLIGTPNDRLDHNTSSLHELMPVSMLNLAFRLAKSSQPKWLESLQPTSTEDLDRIVPGKHVAALWVWGDCRRGPSGVVAERRGDDVLLFGHHVLNTRGLGFLLVNQKVLGITSEVPTGAGVVTEHGGAIGAVYYDNDGGAVARLGVVPPSTELNFSWNRQIGSTDESSRHYRLALHPQSISFFLRMALQDAMSLVLVPRDAVSVTIELTVDGSSTSRLDVPIGNHKLVIPEAVAMGLYEILSWFDIDGREPHRIDFNLLLKAEQE